MGRGPSIWDVVIAEVAEKGRRSKRDKLNLNTHFLKPPMALKKVDCEMSNTGLTSCYNSQPSDRQAAVRWRVSYQHP